MSYTLTTLSPGLTDVDPIYGTILGGSGTLTYDNGKLVGAKLTVNADKYGTYNFSGTSWIAPANPQPPCVIMPCSTATAYVDFSLGPAFGPPGGPVKVSEVFSWDTTAAGGSGLENWSGFGTLTSNAPEPSTWALSLIGTGIVGGALRRRRTRAAA